MDTGKNLILKEYVDNIRKALKDESNDFTTDGYILLESLAVQQEEVLKLNTSPVKEVLGHCVRTEANKNGLTFLINLTDKGRKVVDDITAAEQLYWNIYDARHSKEANDEEEQ